MHPPRPDNLILIGMPSAGKTTIGGLLARQWDYRFKDTDDTIRSKTGRQLEEIIARQGVAGFIRTEAACVKTVGGHHQVIATGGSVIYDGSAMAHLADLGRLVYLFCPLSILARRVGDLEKRGVVRKPHQDLADLFHERHPRYLRAAHQVVDCSQKEVDDIISVIVGWHPQNHPLRSLVQETLDLMQIERPPTVTDLSREMARRYYLDPRQARAAITNGTKTGHLEYRDHCGHIVVGDSMQKPVQVAEGLYLLPQGQTFRGQPADKVVTLSSGAAFGSGRHPSTRLAIRLLHQIVPVMCADGTDQVLKGLDIGTGNGVLALVSVRLGLSRCVGLDTDPNARYEARLNTRLNDLDHQITIPDMGHDSHKENHLIMANLRFPTLLNLADEIREGLLPGGYLVVSGLKKEERSDLMAGYGAKGFVPHLEHTHGQWLAMAFTHPGTESAAVPEK